MGAMNRLNSKQQKLFYKILQDQFGYDTQLDGDLYLHPKERKVFFTTVAEDDLKYIRVNSYGIYIAQYNDDFTELRLSIEGSQLIGPHATKNVVEIENARQWLRGTQFPLEHENAYVIVKNKNDYLGCGRIKDNILLNFVPKIRQITSSD